ncbi:arabinose transporter [Bifidobacterium sp. DSM 109958]|uniref:Arabinose transporter n=1 Tax=Bifidobacterium moraviense TaxID=2675323 RepID=A0A7Y0F2N1_9BIFI|nr:MFS transporter [Bifidobacterium sp. DSM 109958]NMN00915.1 arabinose transporter [Bifidobacterium sp. DSM 109958]
MAKQRFFTLPVITLVGLSFMLGMSEFVVVGILPDIATGLGVSEVTVGNLVAMFAFVYAPCTPLGSALSARFPRFATHLGLMGVFLAGNLLCAFASDYAVLVVARILIAMVSGTIVSISMTYAPDVARPEHRTRFIAWVFSGFSIASVVGVPVGTTVANNLGWRWAFHLVNILTVLFMALMVISVPRHSPEQLRIGFLPQFRLFLDRRIQLGVAAVVCGAAATYVVYTYLTPIMRDDLGFDENMVSLGLVVYGLACLWGNLTSGRLAARGTGVEPLTHVRPIYVAHAAVLCSLALAGTLPVYGAAALIALGCLMYLQNSPSQILYMDVAAASHPGSTNLAASLNSMAFNIGIAVGSAVGGLVNDHLGLTWLGPVGAVFALLAALAVTALRPFVPAGGDAAASAAR